MRRSIGLGAIRRLQVSRGVSRSPTTHRRTSRCAPFASGSMAMVDGVHSICRVARTFRALRSDGNPSTRECYASARPSAATTPSSGMSSASPPTAATRDDKEVSRRWMMVGDAALSGLILANRGLEPGQWRQVTFSGERLLQIDSSRSVSAPRFRRSPKPDIDLSQCRLFVLPSNRSVK